MNYDIIKKNLEKLDNAIKTFPDILGKYQKSRDPEIRSLANKVGLMNYINFIDWIEKLASTGQSVIINHEIQFKDLKETLANNCIDDSVRDFIKKKTKRGLVTFLNSELYNKYNGGRRGRGRRGTWYSPNFSKSEAILANWMMQNNLENSNYVFSSYYTSEISNFESELNTELAITQDITKSLIKKINTIKYDFRKINFNLLKSEIEAKIKQKIMSVSQGEQIKCIEASQPGLTLYKIYNVVSYEITSNGNLSVSIKDDNDITRWYSYRLFECITNVRDNNINDILNMIETC